MSIIAALGAISRHGRLMLVAGLVAGIALPGLAAVLRPWLQEMVISLLFIAALRIGPRQALGALRDLPVTAALAIAYQLALPLSAFVIFHAFGLIGGNLSTALILMASAPSIAGSPNLTIMTGHDPAPALRLLILGTAILPLTVLPVFWLLPELGDVTAILAASARLFAVIAGATACAFVVRSLFFANPLPETTAAIDGLSAIAMAVLVVGLMSAAGPALLQTPGRFLAWLAVAFAANIGLQMVAALIFGRTALRDAATPYAIIAGNRNIALFLVALPASVTEPLLLFIGCYQIPMYLTPLLLRRFYARML